MLGKDNYVTGTISLVINNDEKLLKHFTNYGMQLREQDIRIDTMIGRLIAKIRGYFPSSHPMFHDEQWELHKEYAEINWEQLAEEMIDKAREAERYKWEIEAASRGEEYACKCKSAANQYIHEHYADALDGDEEYLHMLMVSFEMDKSDVVESYAAYLKDQVYEQINGEGYITSSIIKDMAMLSLESVNWRGTAESHVNEQIGYWREDGILVEIAEECGVYLPEMEDA